MPSTILIFDSYSHFFKEAIITENSRLYSLTSYCFGVLGYQIHMHDVGWEQ